MCGSENPAQSAKGEERRDPERNPWLGKMITAQNLMFFHKPPMHKVKNILAPWKVLQKLLTKHQLFSGTN